MSDDSDSPRGSRQQCALGIDFSIGVEPLADLGSPLTFGRSQSEAEAKAGDKRKQQQVVAIQKTIPETWYSIFYRHEQYISIYH
jgi:hypothetical protein